MVEEVMIVAVGTEPVRSDRIIHLGLIILSL